ncbi:MAG: SET domain-containing protein-lysine N-methyltransferase [Gemmatimonadetes bacterium]|nr:SET domain-containing protein-lysine N-methyltransferase [Gemmatimonadota bacterium]
MASRSRVAKEEQSFVVRRSRIAGRGAFATRDIAKGDRIIEYVGERISHGVSDERYGDVDTDAHHTFLFNVNRSVVIDASFGGNDSRFINHSCNPNCESEIEKGRVYIDAIRNIRKGDELTYDYAYGRDGTETLEDETDIYVCRCGAKKCRGTILEPITKAERKKLEAKAKVRHHDKHAPSREPQRRTK